jgi:nucleoside-diphosphate-sugar epimerase
MRKILLTGGEGFVGSGLQTLVHKSEELSQLYSIKSFDLRSGQDIRNYDEVRNSIDFYSPDLIIHLAAQAYVPESTTNPKRGICTNLIGTLNLLEAVKQTGSQARILIAGTSEEYGYDRDDKELSETSTAMPSTTYGVSKLAATTLAMTYVINFGLSIVVTRAWNHIGPGSSTSYAAAAFAKRIAMAEKYGTSVKHGNLDSMRNYTDSRDVIYAYLAAIDCPSGIYNVAGDYTVSAKWILDTLSSKVDKKINFEANENLFRPMSLKFPKPNIDKLVKVTGWSPKIPLEDTLEDMLNYWRSNI